DRAGTPVGGVAGGADDVGARRRIDEPAAVEQGAGARAALGDEELDLATAVAGGPVAEGGGPGAAVLEHERADRAVELRRLALAGRVLAGEGQVELPERGGSLRALVADLLGATGEERRGREKKNFFYFFFFH